METCTPSGLGTDFQIIDVNKRRSMNLLISVSQPYDRSLDEQLDTARKMTVYVALPHRNIEAPMTVMITCSFNIIEICSVGRYEIE